MEFPYAEVAADVVSDVFPRSAADDFTLETIRIFLGGVVAIFGVKVVGDLPTLSV